MSSDEMLIFQNGLSYQLPVPTSLVVDKTCKRNYFNNRTYSAGQTMVCTWNTGSEFINIHESSLVVKIKVESTNVNQFACNFGIGSACNIIKNIRINHRSGVSYTNTQEYDLFRAQEDAQCENIEWFDSVGKNMGYNVLSDHFKSGDPEHTFVIPLYKVSEFFNPKNGVKYLPSNMSGALRVEIDLNSLGQIFKTEGGVNQDAPTSYSITDIYFNLSSCVLMDSAVATINTIAQSKSLEYLYTDVFTNRSTIGAASTALNVDINKAVSFCQKANTYIVLDTARNNIDNDGLISNYYDASWTYRLGSSYYPSNQRIDDVSIAYDNQLNIYKKKTNECGKGGLINVNKQDFIAEHGSYSVMLETDSALNLSAMPITSSRVLRLDADLTNAIGQQGVVLTYLSHLVSARTTLTTSRVDI